jgi:hypothetical protein
MRDMAGSAVSRHIERLKTWRVPGDRVMRLSDAVDSMQQRATRVQQQLGSFIDAWDQLVPDAIVRSTRVDSKRGGTVHVIARSASVAFELDRHLRNGLLNDLRHASRGSITAVRVRVGSVDVGGTRTR